MVLVRTAIEIPSSFGVVHGLSVDGGDGGRVLFVHDLGADLDQFGGILELVAVQGFEAVAVDLPGHGLSGDTELEPQHCLAVVGEVVAHLAAGGAAVGLVSAGRTATVGALLGRADGVAAQLLINPQLDEAMSADRTRTHAVRMVVHSDGPSLVGTATQRFFSYLIGEKLLLYNSGVSSPASITELPSVRSHVELFFNRYLQHPS